MSWNADFVRSHVTVQVNATLLVFPLAGLDEKQFGFSSQRGAIISTERFHQQLDADTVAIYTIHTTLLAVAENATHHTVPFWQDSAGQVLHQGQHLLALTVPLNLYLEAKPSEDFL